MHCHECGQDISTDKAFCSSCGTKLRQVMHNETTAQTGAPVVAAKNSEASLSLEYGPLKWDNIIVFVVTAVLLIALLVNFLSESNDGHSLKSGDYVQSSMVEKYLNGKTEKFYKQNGYTWIDTSNYKGWEKDGKYNGYGIYTWENGEYKGDTMFSIISAIQKFYEINGKTVSLLSDPKFASLRNVVSNTMREKVKQGVGLFRKKAEVISVEIENSLWENGILGCQDPETLLHTMFWIIGINFGLKGGRVKSIGIYAWKISGWKKHRMENKYSRIAKPSQNLTGVGLNTEILSRMQQKLMKISRIQKDVQLKYSVHM